MAIASALALLDFAPVFLLALGLFFLAQLVDRLDSRCRRMALTGFALTTLGGLARASSNLALAFAGPDIPLLTTALYVFAGPGFTLMAAALIRARATALGRPENRDPWLAPTAVSWLFLLAAFYLNATVEGDAWSRALLVLAVIGSAATSITSALLGWRRQLHMAAGLFAWSIAGTTAVVLLHGLVSQTIWIQMFEVILNLSAQAAFAFAAWRVAAEYHARVGPTAGT